jgi:hypothetical protein
MLNSAVHMHLTIVRKLRIVLLLKPPTLSRKGPGGVLLMS